MSFALAGSINTLSEVTCHESLSKADILRLRSSSVQLFWIAFITVSSSLSFREKRIRLDLFSSSMSSFRRSSDTNALNGAVWEFCRWNLPGKFPRAMNFTLNRREITCPSSETNGVFDGITPAFVMWNSTKSPVLASRRFARFSLIITSLSERFKNAESVLFKSAKFFSMP